MEFKAFKKEELSDKSLIVGGKRVKTGGGTFADCNGNNVTAYGSDVRVYRHGKLIKIKYYTID